MKVVKYKTVYYEQVNDIYEKSFPPQEKCTNLRKIIESPNTDFYLRNGFFLTNYMSKEKLENFNVLSNHSKIDIDEYKILDKVVAEILDEPVSNIIEFSY